MWFQDLHWKKYSKAPLEVEKCDTDQLKKSASINSHYMPDNLRKATTLSEICLGCSGLTSLKRKGCKNWVTELVCKGFGGYSPSAPTTPNPFWPLPPTWFIGMYSVVLLCQWPVLGFHLLVLHSHVLGLLHQPVLGRLSCSPPDGRSHHQKYNLEQRWKSKDLVGSFKA